LERTFFLYKVNGSGTFGSVHKARNIKSGKIAAVKIIRSLRGSSLSQDLEREIRIMMKLDHVVSFWSELIVA
jgi:serine/threonine protein kinase